MTAYQLALRCLAPVFLAVAAVHLLLGPGAEVLLGATLSDTALRDPVLDSQNRFYGVAFGLYGLLLLVIASDVARYRPVLLCLLAAFFAAGLARLVSIAATGVPSALVLALLASELLLPPLLWLWLSRLQRNKTERPT